MLSYFSSLVYIKINLYSTRKLQCATSSLVIPRKGELESGGWTNDSLSPAELLAELALAQVYQLEGLAVACMFVLATWRAKSDVCRSGQNISYHTSSCGLLARVLAFRHLIARVIDSWP